MHPTFHAILGLGAAFVTALLFVGFGRCISRWLGVPRAGTAVEFATGSWAMALLLIGFAYGNAKAGASADAAAGPSSLTAVEAWIAFGVLVPFAVLGFRQGTGRPRPSPRKTFALPPWLTVLCAVAWFLPFLLQTLVPDTDWDSAMYHRPTAQRIIDFGVWSADPYRAQINFPATIPLLYAGLMVLDLQSALIPLNMIATLLVFVAVFEIAGRCFGRRAAVWALALTATTNILLELGVDQRSDGFLALFFCAALQITGRFVRDPRRVGALPLLGMAMGMAFGTKHTGLLGVGLFGGTALVVMLRRRPRRFVPFFATAMVCLLVPNAFWLVRNAIELRDPVYPFLEKQLLYYDATGELRAFYPDFEKLYAKAEKPDPRFLKNPGGPKEPGHLFNLWDVFVHADRYQNKSYHWLQPLLFLAFLLPFVDRRPRYLLPCAAGCLSFVALGFNAHLVRYAIPAYPLLAVGAAALLSHRRLRQHTAIAWLCGGLTAGLAVHNSYREWRKLERVQPLAYLSGEQSAYEWRIRQGYNTDKTASGLAHLVNQRILKGEIPEDTTILMVAESKVELLLCKAIPDVSAEVYPFLTEFLRAGGDYETLRANLRRFGVDYVAINRQQVSWAVRELEMNSELQNVDYLRFGVFHAWNFCNEKGERILTVEDKGGIIKAELFRLH